MSTETEGVVMTVPEWTPRFPTQPRGPLMRELRAIVQWVYDHERRGERVSDELADLVDRIEYRAWMRGNDHLPIDDAEDERARGGDDQ